MYRWVKNLESRMLRRIYGPEREREREELKEERRVLRKRVSSYPLVFFGHLLRLFKSRRVNWTGQVALMGEISNA
jgi:hypothetical protein